jgi:hypothetical protein
VEGQGKTPFRLRGQELAARLAYDRRGPRYFGDVSMRPLDVQWGGRRPLPIYVSLAAAIGAGRIQGKKFKVGLPRSQS